MENRFKFRGWDKPSYDFPNGCMTYFNIHKEIGDVDIIMQCTGLKDENGKFIYEGDIVNIWGNPEDYNGYTGHNYIESVEWWEDTCGYGLSEGHGLDECWNIEIIGNIYENPELINPNEGGGDE